MSHGAPPPSHPLPAPAPPNPTTLRGDAAQQDGTIFSALNALLRRRRLVTSCAVIVGLAAALWALTRDRTYTSVSSFMAEGRQSTATGLAAQLGLALPSADGAESPQFYVELLTSREILAAAVATKYAVPGETATPANLMQLYRIEQPDTALRRDAAMARLSGDLELSISPLTNVVTIRVAASSATLAQQLNRRLFDLLGEFNLRRRQSRASQERRFGEERLSTVKAELRVAENRLQYFLQSNRDYRNSPSLVFEYDRLQASVMLLRQLVTTLQQSTEQAKMDEVRDTPTITLVDTPSVPVRPDPRGTLRHALIGAVVGTFLGMGLAFVRETLARPSVRESSDYEEFVRLRREALQDLRRPWRLLSRRPHARPRHDATAQV